MRPIIAGLACGWLLLWTWCRPTLADGGSLQFFIKKSGYQITVFTAPTPLRAGAIDMSVLVQDASTGEPVTPVRVTIRLTGPGNRVLEYPATTEAATNKLFRAAQFELPGPGRWETQVNVIGSQGMAVIGGAVEAAESLPKWPEMWQWIAWPWMAIALFTIHQVLVQRRAARAGPTARDAGELKAPS